MADEFISVQIRGVEQVCAKLKTLPAAIVQRVYARALAAAAVPVVEALEVRTPVSMEEVPLHLKESITTDIAIDSAGKGGRAQVGFGKLGFRARMVEFGHRLIGHGPDNKDLGSVPAHPFMRPATAESAEAAIQAFADALAQAMNEDI